MGVWVGGWVGRWWMSGWVSLKVRLPVLWWKKRDTAGVTEGKITRPGGNLTNITRLEW